MKLHDREERKNARGGPLLLAACAMMLLQCSGTRPGSLGVADGKLSPCPGSPNCVSSQSPDEKHRVAPLHYEGSREEARKRLISIMNSMKRARLAEEAPDYLRFESASRIFGFVDDVEFFLGEPGTVHLRSASRTGYWDLGVNRKRVEKIREMWER